MTSATYGVPTRNTTYVSSADGDIGWIKIGRLVYVHGYFALTTAVTWNSYAVLLSGLPAASVSPIGHGCTLHCGSGSGDRYVVVTQNGTIIPSTLNDMPAGRYGISGVYIAAS